MNPDDINIRVITPGDAALLVLITHDGLVELSGDMPRGAVPAALRRIADAFARSTADERNGR